MRIPPRLILMPFAFSKPSFEAWGFARELARRVGAELVAVHVHEWLMPVGEAPPVGPTPEERRRAKAKLAGTLGPDVKIHYAEGPVVTEVLRLAEKLGADLILMATEGRTGLRRLLRDSVTEEVVRRSAIPVLSVHGSAAMPTWILAPVNLEPYSLPGLEAAEDWARALKAPLTVLHVEREEDPRPGFMTRSTLRERVKSSPAQARLEIENGPSVARIVESSCEGCMVVLVAHRKGLLHDAILGTTAEQVLRRTSAPVLTIPGSVPRRRVTSRRLRGRSGKARSRR